MTQPFLPYAKQNITQEDRESVDQALFEPRITRGEKTAAFEQAVAEYCGASYAVAFSNATMALYAAMQAVDASAQDRFFVPTNTFIATVGCGMRLGLRPQFIDIDRNSGNLDLNVLSKFAKEPTSRGRTIVIPVHFAGIAVDMHRLERLFHDPDLILIEDAAHAIGSLYPTGEKVGSCVKSMMTVFSFHPAKTMTTAEGGMITTNSAELYHRLQRIRNNGIERQAPYLTQGAAKAGYYEVHEISGNYHMTELQAALGLSQIKRLDQFVQKRRELVACYRSHLAALQHIRLFAEEYDARSAYHLMCVQIDFAALKTTREEVMQRLTDSGIGTEVHYVPLYRHPVCAKADAELAYPETEAYYQQVLSLPLYFDLTEADVERVCDTLKKIMKRT